MEHLNKKRIEKLTKIKIKESTDLSSDLKKLDKDTFVKYSDLITSTKPLYNPSDQISILREDKVYPSLKRTKAVKNSKIKKGKYFISKYSITGEN